MVKKLAIQIRYDENFDEMLKIVAQEGFQYISIDFSTQHCFFNENGMEEIERIQGLLSECKLKCIMTHAPNADTTIGLENAADMDNILLSCVKATILLGADIMVVYPRTAQVYEKSYEYNINSLLPLVRRAEADGCTIGIQNPAPMQGMDNKMYTHFPEEYVELIDGFQSSNVCAVWDFGHANLMYADPVHALKLVGGRMEGAYVHNNNKVHDDHFPPFWNTDGWGPAVQWESIIAALKETGYQGFLILDVDYDFEMGIRSFIKNAYESLEILDELLGNHEVEAV